MHSMHGTFADTHWWIRTPPTPTHSTPCGSWGLFWLDFAALLSQCWLKMGSVEVHYNSRYRSTDLCRHLSYLRWVAHPSTFQALTVLGLSRSDEIGLLIQRDLVTGVMWRLKRNTILKDHPACVISLLMAIQLFHMRPCISWNQRMNGWANHCIHTSCNTKSLNYTHNCGEGVN